MHRGGKFEVEVVDARMDVTENEIERAQGRWNRKNDQE